MNNIFINGNRPAVEISRNVAHIANSEEHSANPAKFLRRRPYLLAENENFIRSANKTID